MCLHWCLLVLFKIGLLLFGYYLGLAAGTNATLMFQLWLWNMDFIHDPMPERLVFLTNPSTIQGVSIGLMLGMGTRPTRPHVILYLHNQNIIGTYANIDLKPRQWYQFHVSIVEHIVYVYVDGLRVVRVSLNPQLQTESTFDGPNVPLSAASVENYGSGLTIFGRAKQFGGVPAMIASVNMYEGLLPFYDNGTLVKTEFDENQQAPAVDIVNNKNAIDFVFPPAIPSLLLEAGDALHMEHLLQTSVANDINKSNATNTDISTTMFDIGVWLSSADSSGSTSLFSSAASDLVTLSSLAKNTQREMATLEEEELARLRKLTPREIVLNSLEANGKLPLKDLPDENISDETNITHIQSKYGRKRCLHFDNGYWSYQWCSQATIQQYHRKKQGNAKPSLVSLLGTYSERPVHIDSNQTKSGVTSSEAYEEYFVNGTYCESKSANRSATVRFQCCKSTGAHTNKSPKLRGKFERIRLQSVREEETCRYQVRVCVPELCMWEFARSSIGTTDSDYHNTANVMKGNADMSAPAIEANKSKSRGCSNLYLHDPRSYSAYNYLKYMLSAVQQPDTDTKNKNASSALSVKSLLKLDSIYQHCKLNLSGKHTTPTSIPSQVQNQSHHEYNRASPGQWFAYLSYLMGILIGPNDAISKLSEQSRSETNNSSSILTHEMQQIAFSRVKQKMFETLSTGQRQSRSKHSISNTARNKEYQHLLRELPLLTSSLEGQEASLIAAAHQLIHFTKTHQIGAFTRHEFAPLPAILLQNTTEEEFASLYDKTSHLRPTDKVGRLWSESFWERAQQSSLFSNHFNMRDNELQYKSEVAYPELAQLDLDTLFNFMYVDAKVKPAQKWNASHDHADTPSSVNCGGHIAPSCSECPRQHGQNWCNGDCWWSPMEGTSNDRNYQCIPRYKINHDDRHQMRFPVFSSGPISQQQASNDYFFDYFDSNTLTDTSVYISADAKQGVKINSTDTCEVSPKADICSPVVGYLRAATDHLLSDRGAFMPNIPTLVVLADEPDLSFLDSATSDISQYQLQRANVANDPTAQSWIASMFYWGNEGFEQDRAMAYQYFERWCRV